MVISYITIIQLIKPRNEHWHNTIDYRLYLDFTSFSTNVFFFFFPLPFSPRLLHHICFLCPRGLLQLWQFFCLSLFFMTLILVEMIEQLFYRLFFHFLWCFLLTRLSFCVCVVGEVHRSGVVFFLVSHVRVMSLCSLLVVVTLIMQFRVVFSSVKLLRSPLQPDILGVEGWDYADVPFLISH